MQEIETAARSAFTRDALDAAFPAAPGAPPARWLVAPGLTDYESALAFMEARAQAIARGEADELIWLVEHPPVVTAGTSAKEADLKERRFPVFSTGRGGQYTYHGPGQRVVYAMLDLSRRRRDVRAYVAALERWIIDALGEFNVVGERREDRVGVWVRRPEKSPGPAGGAQASAAEDKIAAIGVRLKHWVSFHGLAINVEPELSHFGVITPCGVADPRYGVTSLVDLGLPVTMDDLDAALKRTFVPVFGPLA